MYCRRECLSVSISSSVFFASCNVNQIIAGLNNFQLVIFVNYRYCVMYLFDVKEVEEIITRKYSYNNNDV